jgi:hypothetical protein
MKPVFDRQGLIINRDDTQLDTTGERRLTVRIVRPSASVTLSAEYVDELEQAIKDWRIE